MVNLLAYEQPRLNKYGTMKSFTHSTGGSSGDNFGTGSTIGKNFNPDGNDGPTGNARNDANTVFGDLDFLPGNSNDDTGAD